MMVHITAGRPVALAIFAASVGTVGPNGDERKKTVFRSSKAFRTHWTASRLKTKVATRALANLATATRPAARAMPAKNVNGIPVSELHDPDTIGLKSPKTVVRISIKTAEPASTMRAATARRIKQSKTAPK